MRVESPKPMHNGGWLHCSPTAAPFVPSRPAPKPHPIANFSPILEVWAKSTPHLALETLAGSLGVNVTALTNLRAAWAPAHAAWAFPMRSGSGVVIGIRLRATDGRKWAVTGSRNGIFIPQDTIPQDTLYVCEGPTDTAAALSMGLYAVGRPSCNCGGPEIAEFCRASRIRRAVVISDNDTPGLRGADKIAGELGVNCCVICPPAKDVREFYRAGGTGEELAFMAQQCVWRK